MTAILLTILLAFTDAARVSHRSSDERDALKGKVASRKAVEGKDASTSVTLGDGLRTSLKLSPFAKFRNGKARNSDISASAYGMAALTGLHVTPDKSKDLARRSDKSKHWSDKSKDSFFDDHRDRFERRVRDESKQEKDNDAEDKEEEENEKEEEGEAEEEEEKEKEEEGEAEADVPLKEAQEKAEDSAAGGDASDTEDSTEEDQVDPSVEAESTEEPEDDHEAGSSSTLHEIKVKFEGDSGCLKSGGASWRLIRDQGSAGSASKTKDSCARFIIEGKTFKSLDVPGQCLDLFYGRDFGLYACNGNKANQQFTPQGDKWCCHGKCIENAQTQQAARQAEEAKKKAEEEEAARLALEEEEAARQAEEAKKQAEEEEADVPLQDAQEKAEEAAAGGDASDTEDSTEEDQVDPSVEAESTEEKTYFLTELDSHGPEDTDDSPETIEAAEETNVKIKENIGRLMTPETAGYSICAQLTLGSYGCSATADMTGCQCRFQGFKKQECSHFFRSPQHLRASFSSKGMALFAGDGCTCEEGGKMEHHCTFKLMNKVPKFKLTK